MSTTVTVQVLRQDDPKGSAYWQSFEIPVRPGMSVVAALNEIRKHPVTTDGQAVPPVVFESGCLSGACGSCACIVNGKPVQACDVLLSDLAQPVRIEPLSAFPVQRDLIVNRLAILDAATQIGAWSAMETLDPSQGNLLRVSSDVRSRSAALAACTSCGICLDACPQVNGRTSYLGPFAMTQAQLFNDLAAGSPLKPDRLDVVLGEGGIAGCGSAQNCVQACPKKLPLAEALADLNRAATGEMFRRLLG